MSSRKAFAHLAIFCGFVVLMAGALSCASSGQVKAVRTRSDELELTAIELERKQTQMASELESLRQKVAELQEAVRAARAGSSQDQRQLSQQMEQLLKQVEDLSQQQVELNYAMLDLEESVAILSAKGSGTTGSKTKSRKEIFAAARADYNRGSYKSAVMGFRNYLEAFPKSSQADDARYWIGESLFAMNDYKGAIAEFSLVVKSYPKSDRVAESLLRLAMCYRLANDNGKAIEYFEELSRRFPDSNESRLAVEALKELTAEKSGR